MAIQFVGGITANYAGATSGANTVSLTSLTGGISSSAAEGDLVLVAVSTAVSNVGTPATDLINDGSSSYTYLRQYTRQNFFTSPFEGSRLELGYKFMGATPDASVTIEPSGDALFAQAVAIMVFRGVDPDTPQDVSLTTAEDGGAADKTNPAAITPSTTGAWIVAVGSAGSSNSYSDFTSADLDNMTSDFGSDNYDCVVGMAYKDDWTSGSFNPVEWNGGSSDVNGAWQAVTLALRPGVQDTTAEAALVLGDITASIAGTSPVSASASNILGMFALAATATIEATASAALSIDDFALTAAGVAVGNDIALTLDPFTLVSAGETGDATAASAIALDAVTLAAAGNLDGVTGSAGLSLGAVTISAAGTSAATGTASLALDAITLASAGNLFVEVVTPVDRRLVVTSSLRLGRRLPVTESRAAGRRLPVTPSRRIDRVLDLTE